MSTVEFQLSELSVLSEHVQLSMGNKHFLAHPLLDICTIRVGPTLIVQFSSKGSASKCLLSTG